MRVTGKDKFKRLMKNIKGLAETSVKIGFFESSKYDDGTPVAYVAAIHEFGYPAGGIPSRSFMRSTCKEQKSEWTELAADGCRALAEGRASPQRVMTRLGGKAAGDVKKTITKIKSPPLKKATVDARRRRMKNGKGKSKTINKPLVDSGVMLAAVSFEVSTGGSE